MESHFHAFSVPSSVSSYDKNQAYSTEWSDDEQPAALSGNENGGNGNSFEDDSSTGKGVRVRALYDYEGQEQDELSFKAGNYQRPDDTGCYDFVCHHRTYIKGLGHHHSSHRWSKITNSVLISILKLPYSKEDSSD